jgi:hypothetical protein
MKIVLYVTLLISLFLSGCATKQEISSSETYVITIKNKQIALSDTGFINQGKDYTNVQIFSAGSVLFNLEMMGSNICLDGKCMDKLSFNQQFFQQEHYAGLMQDVIAKVPIYESKNLKQTSTGFEQEFELANSHIIYRVEGQNLTFRDTKNGILLRLKPLP